MARYIAEGTNLLPRIYGLKLLAKMRNAASSRLRVCLAAAQGGHLAELLTLRQTYEDYDHFYILNDGPLQATCDLARVHIMPDYGSGNPIVRAARLMFLMWRSVVLFVRHHPNVLISTGPLTGIFMALLVRLNGGQVLFVECSAHVTQPSRSGKLFYLISSAFYVQWESLIEYYPNAEYLGPLL